MPGERAARYSLTGLQRTYLETVRDRMTDEDRVPLTVIDAKDGVTFERPETLKDVVMFQIAKWVMEDGPEASIGEVSADD